MWTISARERSNGAIFFFCQPAPGSLLSQMFRCQFCLLGFDVQVRNNSSANSIRLHLRKYLERKPSYENQRGCTTKDRFAVSVFNPVGEFHNRFTDTSSYHDGSREVSC